MDLVHDLLPLLLLLLVLFLSLSHSLCGFPLARVQDQMETPNSSEWSCWLRASFFGSKEFTSLGIQDRRSYEVGQSFGRERIFGHEESTLRSKTKENCKIESSYWLRAKSWTKGVYNRVLGKRKTPNLRNLIGREQKKWTKRSLQ